MKIKFAEKNDRKAVWVWLKDPMSTLFTNDKSTPDYRKHCKWFDMMSKKERIIIGVKGNLRIGLGILFQMPDKLVAKFYVKPVYCGELGQDFVSIGCQFLSQQKGKPIYVDCFSNENIQDLLVIGFLESEENFLKYGS
jgi:hypothetical protein